MKRRQQRNNEEVATFNRARRCVLPGEIVFVKKMAFFVVGLGAYKVV